MRYYDLIETPSTGKTFLEGGAERIPQSDEMVSIYFQKVDLVKYDRGFDSEGYPILKEYALQEDGTRYPYYLEESVDGVYQPDVEKIGEAVIETNETAAKATRTIETDANITVLDAEWQVDPTSLTDIKDAITTAQDMLDLGETPPETIMWTLANNKERETTLVELKQVKLAHALRKAEIFSQYQAWRAGDKLSEFEVV